MRDMPIRARWADLSREQREAVTAIQTICPEHSRWVAETVRGDVESVLLTVFYQDEVTKTAMRDEPGTLFTRKVVIDKDGHVVSKEMVSF